MRMIAVALALALSAAGCSNHPIIDDVTPYTTYDVVHKIRCEAKEPLKAHAKKHGFDVKRGEIDEIQKAIKKERKALDKDQEYSDLKVELAIVNSKIDETKKKLASVRLDVRGLQRRLEELADERDKRNQPLRNEVRDLRRQLETAKSREDIEKVSKGADELKSRLADLDKRDEPERQRIAELLRTLESEVKTREAVSEVLLERLVELVGADGKGGLLKAFGEREGALKTLTNKLGDEGELNAALKFLNSGIAMQFRFDITEQNIAKVDGSYTMPVHLGSFTLNYNAGADKKRRGERAVGVAATFGELLDVDCALLESNGKRARLYPITGDVGIRELVREYLEISGSAKLALSAGTAGTTKQFSDRLVFTTKINGGVAPKLELKPTPQHKVTVNGDLSASREDIHEVIVDIAPPKKKEAEGPAEPARISIESVPELGIKIIRDRDAATR